MVFSNLQQFLNSFLVLQYMLSTKYASILQKNHQFVYYNLKPLQAPLVLLKTPLIQLDKSSLIVYLNQFGLLQIGILLIAQPSPPMHMSNPHYSQTKLHFDNGKTFYVDLNQIHTNYLSQPFHLSNSYHPSTPLHLPAAPSHLIQSSHLQQLSFTGLPLNTRHSERVLYGQLQEWRSLENAEAHTKLKGLKQNGTNKSQGAQTPLAKSSKKNRIFESRNSACNGTKRSFTNLQKIETKFSISDRNNKKMGNQWDKTTKPSTNLCFSRINQHKYTDQLPSYQKKLSNDASFNNPAKHIVTNSQPLGPHQTYVTTGSKKNTASPQERLNFINQIESKHFIGMQESKPSLAHIGKFDSNRNVSYLQGSNNCRSSKNVTRQMLPSKRNLQSFQDQSTLKAGNQKQKGNTKSNHQLSISNIEQDNGLSRYFDNEDELLPMLNRISYKNVEIQNKPSQRPQEIVTHNIFMDFQKAPNSPLLNRRLSKHLVHYDCTFNQGQRAIEFNLKPVEKVSIENTMIRLINKIPLILIFLTICLLIIQIIT